MTFRAPTHLQIPTVGTAVSIRPAKDVLVQHVMSTKVVTVSADDSLADAKDALERGGFHHLPVVDNGHLVGVVSDRDVLHAISPFIAQLLERKQDVGTLDRRIHQIMSRHPVLVAPGETVSAATKMLLEKKVSCLLVVRADRALVGIVTWRDLLRSLMHVAEG
jgi:acetoin utilization protein AcuB